MATRIVPLFPLNLVLFPGMVLPLRIFEPRYRLMMRRLLDGDRQFGVVLIKEGEEVGGSAVPHAVGTIAEISQYEVQEDGQILLVCVGLRRFRIEREVEGEPYQQAAVEILDEGDPAAPMPAGLLERANELLDTYLEALASVSNLSVTLPDEPLSPIDMSYLMAATLQVDNPDKQAILEIPGAEARLERLIALMTTALEALQTFLLKGRTRGDFYFKGRRISMN